MFRSDTPGQLNGFLDAGSRLKGQLSFEDTFRVDGHFEGTVVSKGELVIGEGGVLEGEVQVGSLYVSGEVRGQVVARQRVEIGARGRVTGEIRSPILVIEEGAHFDGLCTMDRGSESVAPKVGTVAAEVGS